MTDPVTGPAPQKPATPAPAAAKPAPPATGAKPLEDARKAPPGLFVLVDRSAAAAATLPLALAIAGATLADAPGEVSPTFVFYGRDLEIHEGRDGAHALRGVTAEGTAAMGLALRTVRLLAREGDAVVLIAATLPDSPDDAADALAQFRRDRILCIALTADARNFLAPHCDGFALAPTENADALDEAERVAWKALIQKARS